MVNKMAKSRKSKKNGKRNSTRNFILGLIILFLVVAIVVTLTSDLNPPKDEEAVAATVNGEKIYSEYLDAQYEKVPEQLRASYTKQVLLDQIIDRVLVFQEAAKAGISVTEDEIQAVIDEISRDLPEGKTLEEALTEDSLALDDVKVEIQQQLLLSKFLEEKVFLNIGITAQEIDNFAKESFEGIELTNETRQQIERFLLLQKQKDAYSRFINQTRASSEIVILIGGEAETETAAAETSETAPAQEDEETAPEEEEAAAASTEGQETPGSAEEATEASAVPISLADCLKEKKAILYGSEKCTFTTEQIALFGEEAGKINFFECNDADGYISGECAALGIDLYPTWSIDGKSYKGMQTLEQLKALSDC
ncbi:MAG: hypothetical protein QS98_C0010G0032 [archaeon GW2011_AR3]|nr:MAG: hypothetical protein QS98_C0010G0032 [archaeon GW2011_AR3]MBS3110175.1 SurA N-terminal domain-containing protein [Candidatus Woesearchaeota archaeon]